VHPSTQGVLRSAKIRAAARPSCSVAAAS